MNKSVKVFQTCESSTQDRTKGDYGSGSSCLDQAPRMETNDYHC